MTKILMSMALIAGFSSVTHAKDYYLSGTLGMGSLDDKGYSGDKYDNDIAYGVKGGFLLGKYFTAGLAFQRLGTRNGVSPETTSTSLLAESAFYFSGNTRSSAWISILAGVTQISVGNRSYQYHEEEYGATAGLSTGYNFRISDQLSIGPQLNYLYIKDAGKNNDYSEASATANLMFTF